MSNAEPMSRQRFIAMMTENYKDYLNAGAEAMEFATDMAQQLVGEIDSELLQILNEVESPRELRGALLYIADSLPTATT